MLIPHGKSFGEYLAGKPAPFNLPKNYSSSFHRNSTFGGDSTFEGDIMAEKSSTWVIVLTIIGIVVADYCADALQNPSRAYLLDVCDEGM